mmetsp:Transcript_33980/g.90073  ORF Transcript_33980/g.90073 Transcript_33980/m.90073 type:complete len:409 (+) Transcript_33980:104-1330(+)
MRMHAFQLDLAIGQPLHPSRASSCLMAPGFASSYQAVPHYTWLLFVAAPCPLPGPRPVRDRVSSSSSSSSPITCSSHGAVGWCNERAGGAPGATKILVHGFVVERVCAGLAGRRLGDCGHAGGALWGEAGQHRRCRQHRQPQLQLVCLQQRLCLQRGRRRRSFLRRRRRRRLVGRPGRLGCRLRAFGNRGAERTGANVGQPIVVRQLACGGLAGWRGFLRRLGGRDCLGGRGCLRRLCDLAQREQPRDQRHAGQIGPAAECRGGSGCFCCCLMSCSCCCLLTDQAGHDPGQEGELLLQVSQLLLLPLDELAQRRCFLLLGHRLALRHGQRLREGLVGAGSLVAGQRARNKVFHGASLAPELGKALHDAAARRHIMVYRAPHDRDGGRRHVRRHVRPRRRCAGQLDGAA